MNSKSYKGNDKSKIDFLDNNTKIHSKTCSLKCKNITQKGKGNKQFTKSKSRINKEWMLIRNGKFSYIIRIKFYQECFYIRIFLICFTKLNNKK